MKSLKSLKMLTITLLRVDGESTAMTTAGHDSYTITDIKALVEHRSRLGSEQIAVLVDDVEAADDMVVKIGKRVVAQEKTCFTIYGEHITNYEEREDREPFIYKIYCLPDRFNIAALKAAVQDKHKHNIGTGHTVELHAYYNYKELQDDVCLSRCKKTDMISVNIIENAQARTQPSENKAHKVQACFHQEALIQPNNNDVKYSRHSAVYSVTIDCTPAELNPRMLKSKVTTFLAQLNRPQLRELHKDSQPHVFRDNMELDDNTAITNKDLKDLVVWVYTPGRGPNFSTPPSSVIASLRSSKTTPSLGIYLAVGGTAGAAVGALTSTILTYTTDFSPELVFGIGIPSGIVLGLITAGIAYGATR